MPKLKIVAPKPIEEGRGEYGEKVLWFEKEYENFIWEYYDPHLYWSLIKWECFVLVEVVKDEKYSESEVFFDEYALKNGYSSKSRFSKKVKEKWGI
jgi:hypothetical protein